MLSTISKTEAIIFFSETLNLLSVNALTLSLTSPGFYAFPVKVFVENTIGKGEIAGNEQFLLFPQCFQSF